MADAADDPQRGVARHPGAGPAPRDRGPALPRRFFKEAAVVAREGMFVIVLDGRSAKTPARRDLALPTDAAAGAVAAEWNSLGEIVDPAALPMTRLANAAIDGVAAQPDAVLDEIVNYVGSDLLFYRADAPERLTQDQARAWDPVLNLYRDEEGARFVLAKGVMPVAQPPATLSLMRQRLAEAVGEGPGAPFRLAALNVMTTLTGSALLALAVQQGRLSAETAWAAAHVDEMFQESQWGQDGDALERRSRRWIDMRSAATLGALSEAK